MTGLDGIFGVLIFVTVALTAFSVGLLTTPERVASVLRDRRFALVLLVNCVLVPVVGYLVVTALPLDKAYEAGVILCAICAGGPLALKATQISRGDVTWSLASTVTLLVLNVLTLPIWSAIFLAESYSLRPGDLAGVLGLAILVPVAVGFWWGRRAGSRVEDWSGRAALISNVTLVLAVLVGVGASAGDLLSSALTWLLLAVVLVVAAGGLMAWALSAEPARRRANTLTTLNRATSVALLVIGRALPDEGEVFAAAVGFGVVQTVVAVGLAVRWRSVRTPAVVTG